MLVVAAVVSVQFGGALAATLVPRIGAAGSVALRLVFSAAVMLAGTRPRLRERSAEDWATVTLFAVVLATMNLCFYAAIGRLPIGVAVTVEFVGPLTLAAAASRRPRDLASVLTAGLGVVAISGAVTTPWGRLDVVGLLLALAAGSCWAAYIVVSARTGARFAQLDGLAIAMGIGALLVAPVGFGLAGTGIWHLDIVARGLGIAMLSSAVPYSLELVALRRLSAQVFGILLSLEPAVAAVAGLVVLDQRLSTVQLAGMAAVVAASALVLGARPAAPRAGPGGS